MRRWLHMTGITPMIARNPCLSWTKLMEAAHRAGVPVRSVGDGGDGGGGGWNAGDNEEEEEMENGKASTIIELWA